LRVFIKRTISKKKGVSSKARYLRYNWRESSEDLGDLSLTKYYFDAIDNKFREQKIERILDNLQN
jgi:hypothetical protein